MTGYQRYEPINVALIFPPFFFNRFHGPYLALPHLISYLIFNGVTAVSHHDANIEVLSALSSPSLLEYLLSEHEKSKPMVNGEFRKHRLHEKLVLAFLKDFPEQLNVDEKVYRQFAALILDHYYFEIKKDLNFQIKALGHRLGLPPFYQGIDKTVTEIPRRTMLVGISVPTADQFFPALVLAQKTKERFGNAVHITLGGCLFSLFDLAEFEMIFSTGLVDSIVRFEGERALLGLYEYVSGKVDLGDICNLIYYQDHHVRFTATQAPVPLSECPPPYFRREELAYYASSAYVPILVSRGCYWGKCTFCDYRHLYGRKPFECILASRACEVIENVIDTIGARRFDLISDCAPPIFCKQFSAEIIRRRFQIEWTTHLRGDRRFTGNLCQQMSRSGCKCVSIGVESFNSRVLKLMNKGYRRNGIILLLRNLNNTGIETTISMIIDFPGITQEEMQETLNCLREYRFLYSAVRMYPFSLSRYSEIAKKAIKYDIHIVPEADIHHNRGFHYLKFNRTNGATDEQTESMMIDYLLFCAQNDRDIAIEESLKAIQNNPLNSLQMKVQPRFHFLDEEEAHRIWELLDIRNINKDEGLFFDVDRNAIFRYPTVLRRIYKAFPNGWIPMLCLQRLVGREGDSEWSDERDCIKPVIKCGVILGLFTVRCCELVNETHSLI